MKKGISPEAALARALSKLGYCSRRQAIVLVLEGRVRVNGVVREDPERRVRLDADRIEVDGTPVAAGAKVYLALNKPRGLVTTASDERGRKTVYDAFAGAKLPFVSPVGRLDQASEGLLLFTNDTAWAARLTDPATHMDKTYHVQIDRIGDAALIASLVEGRIVDGERLAAKRASLLRLGGRNSWLEIVLDEGKNRQLRRLLEALGIEVLRLVRVSIGPLRLGTLAKGAWRRLDSEEIAALSLL